MTTHSDVVAVTLRVIKYIDRALGQGYAKEHPELIAAFMGAVAIDHIGAAKTIAMVARAIKASANDEGQYALKERLAAMGMSVEDMVKAELLVAGDDIAVPY